MCKVKVKIQVFKKKLHILINLNETRIYKKMLLVHTLTLPLHRLSLAFCSMKKSIKLKKKKKVLHFVWETRFHGVSGFILLCFTLSCAQELCLTFPKLAKPKPGAESRIFIWGGQIAALIYLSKQPPTFTYTHVFLLYTHFFYLISYIYTHTKKKKKELSIFNQNYVWWRFFIK